MDPTLLLRKDKWIELIDSKHTIVFTTLAASMAVVCCKEFHLFKGPNWESHLIQLPNGDIHCYFAYPRPWISDANSGTALVVSKDGGKTWEPEQGEYPYFVMRSVYWAEA